MQITILDQRLILTSPHVVHLDVGGKGLASKLAEDRIKTVVSNTSLNGFEILVPSIFGIS